MADANMPHRVEREWTAADKDWSDIDLCDNCDFTDFNWTIGVDWCLPRQNLLDNYHQTMNQFGIWLRVFDTLDKKQGDNKYCKIPNPKTFQDACLITGVRSLTDKAAVDKLLEDYPHVDWALHGPTIDKPYVGSLFSSFDSSQEHLHVRFMFVSEQIRLICLSWSRSRSRSRSTSPVDVVIGRLLDVWLLNQQEQIRLICLFAVILHMPSRSV